MTFFIISVNILWFLNLVTISMQSKCFLKFLMQGLWIITQQMKKQLKGTTFSEENVSSSINSIKKFIGMSNSDVSLQLFIYLFICLFIYLFILFLIFKIYFISFSVIKLNWTKLIKAELSITQWKWPTA